MTIATKLLLTCLVVFLIMQVFNDLVNNEYGSTVRLCWAALGASVVSTGFISIIAAIWGY